MSLKLAETLHTKTHDLTKVSRENRKIERRLEKQLNDVANLIRRVQASDTTGGQTITSIQTRLDKEVGEILRANIQASYQLGIAYVSTLLRREPFFTINDIMACDTLVNDYSRRFQGRTTLLFSRPELPESNVIVTSMATDVMVKSLNLATAQKTKELIGMQQLRRQQGRISKTRILNPSFVIGGIEDIQDRLFNIDKRPVILVWVISQDDKVCPECESLEGQEWDINDFNIPTPGHESTHWNCRCRLMLAEREE